VLTATLAPFPGSRREFVNSMNSWLGRKLWSLNTISSRLDVDADRISYFSHHYSHAVQAFMGSGFDDAAILIVDAVGDWACTAMFKGRWVDGRPEVTRVLEIAFPNSLGLVYSAYTAYLGFNPNDSECSTMALAAFGTPRYADKVREIIAPLEDRTYEVDQRYFHFTSFYKGAVTEKFVEAFGPPRSSRSKLPQSCFGTSEAISPDAQRYADVAASVQLVLEERILQLCERLRTEVDSKNLCYAGGVSLNCVANYKILAQGLFENVFIPPDPGDGGTSVGTALSYAATNATYDPKSLEYGPYLGSDFDETDDVRMIDYVKPEHVRQYLKRGVTDAPTTRWQHRTFANEDELIAEVTQRLVDKQIIGWCQSRAEIGPRALGNRSILIRPDDVELALRLSRLVKDRALYRPYAFSISAKDAPRVLDVPEHHIGFNRWMQYAVPVKSAVADRVIAALHTDRTTRAQVCFPTDNPRYHALLESVGQATGLGVLLNTSFNASGYPIVSSGVEALVMFARTGMDALVLNNTIVWKR
jgi:carbamoyltransferase